MARRGRTSLGLFLLLSLTLAKCEFFTALVDLEHLVSREKELQEALKRYVEVEESRLAQIKKFLAKVDTAHELATKYGDIGGFLGHPVNSFALIKRFHKGWSRMEELALKDTSEVFVETLTKHKDQFPSQEDVDGAITALLRLQDTYRLTPDVISTGRLPKVRAVPMMTVSDTFDIGRSAYLSNDMFYTKAWMEVALEKIKKGEDSEDVKLFDVYDHLAFAEYQRGNFKKALNYSEEMVKIDPTHTRATDNVAYFGSEIAKQTKKRGDTGTSRRTKSPSSTFKKLKEREYFHRTKAFQNYEKLCRGEVRSLTKWEQGQMSCWQIRDDPLTVLKPGRIERVFVKPEVLIFRNFITDSEIKRIKELATPRLKRATVKDPVTGELIFANYRISKSGWLRDEEDELVKRISYRVQAYSGLNMTTSEDLQVVNYGIGGHYEPHYDFARDGEDKFTSLGTGNRIATFLSYLSDVEAGGGTVFTRVGATVWPQKGDAAFWYNLKRSGDGDSSTRHAACPVLVGSKWVANKWIHEVGQEFRKPCSVDRNALFKATTRSLKH
ncbi:prolyl 4-hydroxylase subunit alpha-1 isoform X2 [Nematostella vectensis]|uniref:prolyl 4-hydroxylase subunit alpha-1 isoform X2 n=1 Tax=Nematostella vectensis TaxID=45351 RepID=UPI00207784ED|nr:prolyl 4-hydroxylase subunit alpha-1 isoform X2 [Nematostella vectensis]